MSEHRVRFHLVDNRCIESHPMTQSSALKIADRAIRDGFHRYACRVIEFYPAHQIRRAVVTNVLPEDERSPELVDWKEVIP